MLKFLQKAFLIAIGLYVLLIVWSFLFPSPGNQNNTSSGNVYPPPTNYIWDREDRPYFIDIFQRKNACGEKGTFVEHRAVWVVYTGELTVEKVYETCEEIYYELKKDIENACPNGKYKMITINLKTDKRETGPMIHVSCKAGSMIPEWPPENISGDIRDQATKPSEYDFNVYYAFIDVLTKADKIVWAPYEGKDYSKEDMFAIEKKKTLIEIQLCKELDKKLKLTRRERLTFVNRVSKWLSGFPVNEEDIQKLVEEDLKYEEED